MNRRNFLSILGVIPCAFSTEVTVGTRAYGIARMSPPRTVATRDKTYRLGKVEPLLSREIESVDPDPEGRYALICQDLRPKATPEEPQPFGENKLWLYDSRRNTTRLLIRLQDNPSQNIYKGLQEVKWLPEERRALIKQITVQRIPLSGQGPDAFRTEITSQITIYDPIKGSLRPLLTLPNTYVSLEQLPGLAGILVTSYPEQTPATRSFRIVSGDGRFSPLATIASSAGFPDVEGVSADGTRLFVLSTIYEKSAQGESTRKETWQSIEISTGTVTLLNERPTAETLLSPPRKTPEPSLVLREETVLLTGKSEQSAYVNALWLEASRPEPKRQSNYVLVAPQIDQSARYLLPDFSAVLYLHDQALYACPITSVDSADMR
jgi:hypothetical protein